MRPSLRRLAGWSAVALTCMGLAKIALPHLAFNATPSLPGLVYWVVQSDRIARGDVVAFRPPANRFYPDGMGFLKVVVGLPGDSVAWRGREVLVNGRPIGLAKERASTGEALELGPAGRLPNDRYFLWTPHPDSFDSRYADIGWIHRDRILGRAFRIL